jgi:NAD(P)-dependent dehydrogenase (short-subunit alcohol dehydrogenase family)
VSGPSAWLEGKTAVVTGGAAGIGLAVSERFAHEGANVAIFDLDSDAAEHAAHELTSEGHVAIACTVDVSERSQVERAVAEVRERLGPVHILVNNAGIASMVPLLSIDEVTWNRVFAVNVTGMFHCTQLIVPDMIDAGWGRIINISSAAAQRGSEAMAAYAASKGAVVSFTRAIAVELGGHGITVNNIPPNFIVTPMQQTSTGGASDTEAFEARVRQTPVGRAGRPEDVAAACSFLASPDAGYITAQTIGVNGGRFP